MISLFWILHSDNKRLIITTSIIATISDLNIIEKYIKELNDIDSYDIMSLRLSQSKSYLKILSIPYFIKDTNLSISSDIVKSAIKSNYILNDIVLALHPHIIKAFPKSNMVVIWIDIWEILLYSSIWYVII